MHVIKKVMVLDACASYAVRFDWPMFFFSLSPSCFDVMEEMVCVVLVCVLVHVQDSLLWLGGYRDFDARLVIMTQF